MNNNLDNVNQSFSNSSNDFLNNNWSQLKDDNNYLNNINNNQSNTLIKSCKKLSTVYIVLWLILVAYFICVCSVLANYNVYITYPSGEIYSLKNGQLSTSWGPEVNLWGVLLGPVGAVFGFILLIIGSFLTNKTLWLKRQYFNYVKKGLFVWFWVGLYLFGICSFIGSILTITTCNKINKLKLLNLIEYPKCNDIKYQQKLVETCKWFTVSYMVIFILLIVLCILALCGVLMNGLLYFLIFGLGIIILSNFIVAKFISLNKFYFEYTEKLLAPFLFGLIIPFIFFVACIIALVEYNKIEKQYFAKKSINKATKKVLSIAFTVIGSAFAIIGAGLIAGTYGSYSNYQVWVKRNYSYFNLKDFLNPNYNIDPSGVIVGSVLLAIGLATLIISGIFLGIIIEKEKKQTQ